METTEKQPLETASKSMTTTQPSKGQGPNGTATSRRSESAIAWFMNIDGSKLGGGLLLALLVFVGTVGRDSYRDHSNQLRRNAEIRQEINFRLEQVEPDDDPVNKINIINGATGGSLYDEFGRKPLANLLIQLKVRSSKNTAEKIDRVLEQCPPGAGKFEVSDLKLALNSSMNDYADHGFSLVTITAIFLTSATILVGGLGAASTEPLKRAVSLIGLVIGASWFCCALEAVQGWPFVSITAAVTSLLFPIIFVGFWLISFIAHGTTGDEKPKVDSGAPH